MAAAKLIGCLATVLLGADVAPPNPFEVVASKPLDSLTRCFHQTSGWTGADGAGTIPLGADKTLWLFADTWIGRIQNQRRLESRMVNNTAGWQSLKNQAAPLRFFWRATDKGPGALLVPEDTSTWYWPGDGVMIDGRLYLFCKVIRRKKEGAPGFQFDWFANDLLQIDNPQDEPTAWKFSRRHLASDGDALRLGVTCIPRGGYLYVYGLFPEKHCKPLDNPLGLARISQRRLRDLDMKGLEYWSTGPDAIRWLEASTEPVALFRDAAAEMSVKSIRGLEGLFAIYTGSGIGRDIMMRWAKEPEGPWSKPLLLYRCPDPEEKVFLYGARAHPEIARRAGEIIITYCRNTGALSGHVRKPYIYFPQAVSVQLRHK